MAATLLTLESFAASIAAGAFFSSAVRVRERASASPDPDVRLALGLFSLWWVGLGLFALSEAGLDLAAALGDLPFLFPLVLTLVQVMAFCIGLWGLMFYVSFVLTGRRSLMAPLAVLMASYYGILLFTLTLGRPAGLHVGAVGAELALADPILSPTALTALFLVPPLIASATYVALFFFTPRDAQRVRVLVVAAGTLGWLASLLLRDGLTARSAWAGLPLVLALLSAMLAASGFLRRAGAQQAQD